MTTLITAAKETITQPDSIVVYDSPRVGWPGVLPVGASR